MHTRTYMNRLGNSQNQNLFPLGVRPKCDIPHAFVAYIFIACGKVRDDDADEQQMEAFILSAAW